MEHCALVIIGGGYAGVNAFNAAARYLDKGDRKFTECVNRVLLIQV